MPTEPSSPYHISVVGLGYVGLPLALQFAECGQIVSGLDNDPNKIKQLEGDQSYLSHIADSQVKSARLAGNFSATTDYASVSTADAILLCLPTPLSEGRKPDLSYVLNTGEKIAPHLKKGTLVCLESSTYPGTTEEELRPVLEQYSGLTAGKDFHLAYSPEREDPTNTENTVADIPKLIGGLTDACAELAIKVYSTAIQTLVPVENCKVAEAAKLLENVFRSVNIALVNELKVVYSEMGIDIWQVIEAAKTKPFGFMPFYPGPGLGGHCIPIDPFYLTWKAQQHGMHTRFIELAGEINTSMPDYVIATSVRALLEQNKPVQGASALILGLAYKPDIDDDRQSPSYPLIKGLEAIGMRVDYHDPLIPHIPLTREYPELAKRPSSPINSKYDLLVLATAHSAYKNYDFSDYPGVLIDTRNCITHPPSKYYRA